MFGRKKRQQAEQNQKKAVDTYEACKVELQGYSRLIGGMGNRDLNMKYAELRDELAKPSTKQRLMNSPADLADFYSRLQILRNLFNTQGANADAKLVAGAIDALREKVLSPVTPVSAGAAAEGNNVTAIISKLKAGLIRLNPALDLAAICKMLLDFEVKYFSYVTPIKAEDIEAVTNLVISSTSMEEVELGISNILSECAYSVNMGDVMNRKISSLQDFIGYVDVAIGKIDVMKAQLMNRISDLEAKKTFYAKQMLTAATPAQQMAINNNFMRCKAQIEKLVALCHQHNENEERIATIKSNLELVQIWNCSPLEMQNLEACFRNTTFGAIFTPEVMQRISDEFYVIKAAHDMDTSTGASVDLYEGIDLTASSANTKVGPQDVQLDPELAAMMEALSGSPTEVSQNVGVNNADINNKK